LENLRKTTPLDRLLVAVQSALSVIAGDHPTGRPLPASASPATGDVLTPLQRAQASALMRVNHVGEVCAQALYTSQSLFTRDESVRAVFRKASVEESDHLAWTATRIEQLGGRVSWLVPVWYGGAFAIGSLAALAGDRISLGFMAETERQVEAHLLTHLDRLPVGDHASRAIVEQMKADEAGHATTARLHGGVALPLAARWAMHAAARVMTTTAHYI
jgi:ubiquinone biosynthesis monooxygenase Coq7